MKTKLLILALLSTAAMSCKKDKPEPPQQTVKYFVKCESCTVYIREEIISVSGEFKYQEPGTSGEMMVAVVGDAQSVKASVISGTKAVGFGTFLGGSFASEKTLILK